MDLSIFKTLPTDALISIRDAVMQELDRRHTIRSPKKLRNLAHTDRLPPTKLTPDDYQRLYEKNSQGLLALPTHYAVRKNFIARLKYLPIILTQDWHALFPGADTLSRNSYVYAHLDPREKPIHLRGLDIDLKGHPFYIGKGSGNRAWDLKRNEGHGKHLRSLLHDGFESFQIVTIVQDNLTELEALTLEAKLIYVLGSIYSEDIQGCLLNLADHMRPTFTGTMKIMQKGPKNKR